jgi:FMN phosphatase YigB (HAD superfamily)
MTRPLTANVTDSNSLGKDYNLVTLDVFDTCLIRDFVSQESLWHLLGRELGARLPGVPRPAEFARLRADAENAARIAGAGADGTREDITLAQVYERLAVAWGWDRRLREQAAAIEEECEARGLAANPAARSVINRIEPTARCYLTDTPHRGLFIEECLARLGLPAGTVLSSGDVGLRKGTGSLFREAMARLEVTPGEILHVGNDLRSDGAGSAVAGVAFGPLLAANPNRYERALDVVTRDAGLLGACLAGAGRAMRLEEAGRFPEALVSVVTGVAGPAIFAAAAWALLCAQADGIATLYFVSRDGEILLAAAQEIQRELGLAAEIECRYLYGSRRAWHLPALSLRDGADFGPALRALLAKPGPATPRQLLARLDLSPAQMTAALTAALADAMPGGPAGAGLDQPFGETRDEVIEALTGSAALAAMARARAAAAYQATVGYLRQQRLLDGAPVGLVDIGWLGHASASLAAVAAAEGTPVRCYFAGGLCGSGSELAPANSRAFLIDARGQDVALRPALVHLLESFCAGSGDSVTGYVKRGARWEPRFDHGGGAAAARWGLADHQALVRRYVRAAARAAVKAAAVVDQAELAALRPALIANLQALWRQPSYAEAEQWGSFPFEGDWGVTMLGRAADRGDVLGYVRHAASPEAWPRLGPWRQAVLVRTVGRRAAGRRVADPFGLLRLLSAERRQVLRAQVGARVQARRVRRVLVRVEDAATEASPTRRRQR